MEVPAVCVGLLMLEFLLLGTLHQPGYKTNATLLRVAPDRVQYFESESVSFHCDETDDPTELRGTRSSEPFTPLCDRKQTPTSCTITNLYSEESGEYWCEAEGGERSNSINITVTAGSVILDSPAAPVLEGDRVTLRCKTKKNPTEQTADFYKDGNLVASGPAADLSISNASRSDEGLYRCTVPGCGTSPQSWLAIRARRQETRSDDITSSRPSGRLWIGTVVVFMLVLVLVLVALLYARKHRVFLKTPGSASASYSVQNDEIVPAEEPADVIYNVVVTKQRKDKEDHHQPVYSTRDQRQQRQSEPEPISSTAAKQSTSTEEEIVYSSVHRILEAETAAP